MAKNKIKCAVCKQRFKVRKGDTYFVSISNGLLAAPTTTSAVDCPKCGCQNILAPYYPRVKKDGKTHD